MDAFLLRETTSADLPLAGIGLSLGASNLKNEYKETKKHKKNKHKDRSRKQDPSSFIDKDRMPTSRDNIKEKNGSKKQNHDPDLFMRQQVKKPRTDGNGGFSGIQPYQKNELK